MDAGEREEATGSASSGVLCALLLSEEGHADATPPAIIVTPNFVITVTAMLTCRSFAWAACACIFKL